MTEREMPIRRTTSFHSAVCRSVLRSALFVAIIIAAVSLQALSGVLTITSVPTAGGSTTGTGVYDYAVPVTLTATPNPGYVFIGWTTDAAGSKFIAAYGYTMPAVDTALYAQFSPGSILFSDDFEAYANDSYIENQGWWKIDYPNKSDLYNQKAYLSKWSIPQLPGSTRYSSSRAANAWDSAAVNLPFHLGGGNLAGNVMVDWMFYDPKGPIGGLSDTLSLSAFTGVTSTADLLSTGSYAVQQRLQVGMQYATGCDSRKYQVQCLGRTDGVNGGTWFNTSKGRSVGWHEGTIFVGAPDTDGSNMITALIDGAYAWQGNSITKVGYNLLELNSAYAPYYGYVGAFDNVRLITSQWPSVTNLAVATDSSALRKINATWSTTFADHSLLQIDNGPWQDPAISPADLILGSYGTHTVSVRAVNVAGQTSPTVTASVLLDMPIVGLTVTPTTVAPADALTATWSCSVTPDHYLVQIDSGAWSQQTSPYSVDTSGLAYGTHTIAVKAVDAEGVAGIPVSASFSVDRSIRTWSVIGSYPWESGVAYGSTRFSVNMFQPAITEEQVGAKTGLGYPTSMVQPSVASVAGATCNSAWTPYTSPNPIVDLNTVYNSPAPLTIGTQWGVSYLCTYVWNNSVDITAVYFTCGSDDGNKIWIDGVPQWLVSSVGNSDSGTIGHDVYGACKMNRDLYGPFTLKSGGNRLLVKLTQATVGYQFQGQLCDATRHELPAVTAGNISYTVSDDTPPTGTVKIGKMSYPSLNVTLNLTATDDLNPITMCFSNDPYTYGFSNPVPFATTATWTLADGPGAKFVYAKFADSCGNETIVTDSYDGIHPCCGGSWTAFPYDCDTAAGHSTGSGVYLDGTSVTFTANPNPGYVFVGWSDMNVGCRAAGPFVSTSPAYTFTIHSDIYLFANYKASPAVPPACTEIAKISDLWLLASDSTVCGLDNANAKAVTAVWSDGFWIAETDRTAGIKVLANGSTYNYFDDAAKSAVQPGDVFDVYGTLSVPSGSDRVLNALYYRDRTIGAGTAIKPLGMTQRYLVGQQASANTPGLSAGQGIYTAGLFVRLAGAVLNPGASSFFLDDKTYLPGTGIKVFCGTLPVPSSGNKIVTGVVGMVGNAPVVYATNIQ